MIAGDLRTGDTFVEHSEKEWADMSERDRRMAKRVDVLGLGPECCNGQRIHIATSAGSWCIPFLSEVTRLTKQSEVKRAIRTLTKQHAQRKAVPA